VVLALAAIALLHRARLTDLRALRCDEDGSRFKRARAALPGRSEASDSVGVAPFPECQRP
jgi:hypothetical protein